MSYQILSYINRSKLINAINKNRWIIACLCAEWCNSCRNYATNFAIWSANYSTEYHFVWIDIEDNSDLVDDFNIENFPTLLIQYGKIVSFFGQIKPSNKLTTQLLKSQIDYIHTNYKTQSFHLNDYYQKLQKFSLHFYLNH